jgi:hypothetical protein
VIRNEDRPQGQVTVAQIPGMNIRFAETKDPVAGYIELNEGFADVK